MTTAGVRSATMASALSPSLARSTSKPTCSNATFSMSRPSGCSTSKTRSPCSWAMRASLPNSEQQTICPTEVANSYHSLDRPAPVIPARHCRSYTLGSGPRSTRWSEYTFKHALTHEVAYAGLLAERRRALHTAVAAAMERLHADRLVEHVERLAHHTRRGEVWDKAARYLRQAGTKVFLRSANREAAACFEQALDALRRLPEHPDAIAVSSRPIRQRRTIARLWPWPRSWACAPSSRTATSASADSTSARASARRRRSTSPPRRRCTARWTCGSGWSRRRRSCGDHDLPRLWRRGSPGPQGRGLAKGAGPLSPTPQSQGRLVLHRECPSGHAWHMALVIKPGTRPAPCDCRPEA